MKQNHLRSKREPPIASIPAIEVFMSRVENDLFKYSTPKLAQDNLMNEEQVILKEFRSTPVEERDFIIRMQDKGNKFVLL